MIGSFSRLIKKNKILVLITMFLIIGILVFLLRSISDNYLENFENDSDTKERNYRHWNVIRGFKFFKDLKECSLKSKAKESGSSLSDYLAKEAEKCGGSGIDNACFKEWTPIEITDEKLEEQEEKLAKLSKDFWGS